MWTMDCAGDDNEVKAVSPLIYYASNIANYTTTSTLAPNNSNDSDCTSAKIIKRPSIFKHLVQPPENKSARSLAVQSTRWSPTAEQLMALEELYKHVTRTPTAIQIQDITTKLRRFGKIEGKNVFYWFQNHKARDKKKQRLRLFQAQCRLQQQSYDSKPKHQSVVPKVTSLEVEQTKREPLSNCSTISEESGSEAVARATTDSRVVQVDDVEKDELQKHVSSFNYPMEIPFCFPMINLYGTSPKALVSLASDSPGLSHVFSNIFGNNNNNNYGIIRETSTIQTLELFPLQSGNLKTSGTASQSDHPLEEPFIGDLSLRLLEN